MCSETEYVRLEFPGVVEFLESHNPCHLHLPVVYQDELHDFNLWFLHHKWEHEVNEEVLQQVRQENSQGIRSMIFSDGSCRNPATPSMRRASYALTFHRQISPRECADIVQTFHQTQKIPDTFQVLVAGPCTDYQSIPRAELLAAMVLMKQRLQTTLYTDSQYVVDVCSKLGYIIDIAQMQSWANFDILCNIWECLQQGQTKLEKVKAHSIDSRDPPNMATFAKLGNHAVDAAAKAMLRHLDAVSPILTNFAERDEIVRRVQQQMNFRYCIQVARAKGLQQTDSCQLNNRGPYSAFQSNQVKLFDLQRTDARSYTFSSDDFDAVQNSLWGTTISHRILHWLSLLKWPATPGTPGSAGITWFELAVNFQTVMQCGLVVNVGTSGNKFQPKQLGLQSTEYAYSKQVAAFERTITTIATLLRREIIPMRRQLSSSLRIFGATHGKQGLVDRPEMPLQQQTLAAIQAHFTAHRGITPEESPTIPLTEPHVIIDDHWTDQRDRQDWRQRIQRYNSARKRR